MKPYKNLFLKTTSVAKYTTVQTVQRIVQTERIKKPTYVSTYSKLHSKQVCEQKQLLHTITYYTAKYSKHDKAHLLAPLQS